VVGVALVVATWAHEPLVRDLVRRCGRFVSTYRSIRDLRSYYDRQGVLVALLDDVPVGFVVLRHGIRNQWTTIHEVGVVPQARRQGIASRIIDAVLAGSPHSRVRLVCDARNVDALAFYESRGFRRLGIRVNKAGEPIIDMEVSA